MRIEMVKEVCKLSDVENCFLVGACKTNAVLYQESSPEGWSVVCMTNGSDGHFWFLGRNTQTNTLFRSNLIYGRERYVELCRVMELANF